jgi:hypothetical protein
MKKMIRFIVAATCITSLASLHAQVTLDTLTATTNWGPSVNLEGNGALTVGGGAMDYTVSAGAENNFTYRKFTGLVGSYTTNWSVRIDVNYGSPDGFFDDGVEQAINTGLMVTRTSAAIALNPVTGDTLFNGFMLNSNLYWDGGAASRDFRTSKLLYDTEAPDNETRYGSGVVSGATTGSLVISFNATTKTLVGHYDADGATGGYAPFSMTSVGGDTMSAATWGMGASDTFSIYFVGNAMFDAETGSGFGPLLTSGDVTLTNFYSQSGLTAIPEPSTYAAMFGAAVLGLALWRRKQRAVAD